MTEAIGCPICLEACRLNDGSRMTKKPVARHGHNKRRSQYAWVIPGALATDLRERVGVTHPSAPLGKKVGKRGRRIEVQVDVDTRGELAFRTSRFDVVVPERYHAMLRALADDGPVRLPFDILRFERATGLLAVVAPPKMAGGRKTRIGYKGYKVSGGVPMTLRLRTDPQLRPRRETASIEARAELRAATGSRPETKPRTEMRDDRQPTMVAAEGFLHGMDPSVVVEAVRRVSGNGQRARIACLANVLHAIETKVGGERALTFYERILPVSDTVEFGEFKPVLLQEIAKVAQKLGRDESAASYALGAIRNALDHGESTVAANLMRQSRRLEIL